MLLNGTGFEFIDNPDHLEVDIETLETRRNLLEFLTEVKSNKRIDFVRDAYPNLILFHDGFLFCSVHLAMRKISDPISESPDSVPPIVEISRESNDVWHDSQIRSVKQAILNLQYALQSSHFPGILGRVIRTFGTLLRNGIHFVVTIKRIKRKWR